MYQAPQAIGISTFAVHISKCTKHPKQSAFLHSLFILQMYQAPKQSAFLHSFFIAPTVPSTPSNRHVYIRIRNSKKAYAATTISLTISPVCHSQTLQAHTGFAWTVFLSAPTVFVIHSLIMRTRKLAKFNWGICFRLTPHLLLLRNISVHRAC